MSQVKQPRRAWSVLIKPVERSFGGALGAWIALSVTLSVTLSVAACGGEDLGGGVNPTSCPTAFNFLAP